MIFFLPCILCTVMKMKSLWSDTATLPSFSMLDGDRKTQVLIIGGGIAGILCAYRLKQEGVDCILLEADRICRGVTGSTTAKITAQHGLIYDKLIDRFGAERAKLYYEANTAAIEAYAALPLTEPLERLSSCIYSVDHPEKLAREWMALRQIGAKAEYSGSVPLPFPISGAIRFPDQAQVHPLRLIAAIAPELNILEHTAAREFIGSRVRTDHGTVTAEKIIVATHFPILNMHGSYFLKMYQHRSYVLALRNASLTDGMYMDEAKAGLSFRTAGELLLLGGGAHRTGKQGGGWAELEKFARVHYPEASVAYRWATQDCMTLDGVPYIGQYSAKTPDLFVATGFNKWGMSSSMVAAMLLCDLVQGRKNRYAAVFSPSRTMLRPQLAVNAAEAVCNLLSFRRKRCPHLGCALRWNAQERTWDCPCHGSRFTADGKLLDNPAMGDLKK